MRRLQLGGGVPEGISGPEITLAATEGDPAALRCFQTVGGSSARAWRAWPRCSIRPVS